MRPVDYNPFAFEHVAAQGRGNDRYLAHLSKNDQIVPEELITPQVSAVLKQILGRQFEQFRVGSGKNAINPKTGLMEFEDGDSGAAGDAGAGGQGGPGDPSGSPDAGGPASSGQGAAGPGPGEAVGGGSATGGTGPGVGGFGGGIGQSSDSSAGTTGTSSGRGGEVGT